MGKGTIERLDIFSVTTRTCARSAYFLSYLLRTETYAKVLPYLKAKRLKNQLCYHMCQLLREKWIKIGSFCLLRS